MRNDGKVDALTLLEAEKALPSLLLDRAWTGALLNDCQPHTRRLWLHWRDNVGIFLDRLDPPDSEDVMIPEQHFRASNRPLAARVLGTGLELQWCFSPGPLVLRGVAYLNNVASGDMYQLEEGFWQRQICKQGPVPVITVADIRWGRKPHYVRNDPGFVGGTWEQLSAREHLEILDLFKGLYAPRSGDS